jgi:hypothetical protein
MSECVDFAGFCGPQGYGIQQFQGKVWRAHRLAWTLAYGPIPDDLCVLHHCDNRSCVNVDHLFLGTRGDNARDMVAKGRHPNQRKTECKYGHPFDAENTALLSSGKRYCRECNRIKARFYGAKARARARQEVGGP